MRSDVIETFLSALFNSTHAGMPAKAKASAELFSSFAAASLYLNICSVRRVSANGRRKIVCHSHAAIAIASEARGRRRCDEIRELNGFHKGDAAPRNPYRWKINREQIKPRAQMLPIAFRCESESIIYSFSRLLSVLRRGTDLNLPN